MLTFSLFLFKGLFRYENDIEKSKTKLSFFFLNWFLKNGRFLKYSVLKMIIFTKLVILLMIINKELLLTIVNNDPLLTMFNDNPLLTILKEERKWT